MVFEQGDIVIVNFNPTYGHEPQNERPALVVSNADFNQSTSMTIVCPITTTDNRFYLHEPLPDGYGIKGVVVMEQVRAIDLEARQAKRLGRLDAADLQPILVCLRSFY
ncbi:MAG: type II toxin-antitoxin system PemK/MazF family toxin [Coriobacteriales bacterium]|jgi:mRNA interferase MazF|nr:type II toxin-antitoxin system PemK/MazF family toxin [Coriobacteriales bacterium]